MTDPPIQDQYLEPYSHCFGCGRNNSHGLHIKSYFDDDELVCLWLPDEHHIAFPGYLNGGIIATIIDCHGIGMAVANAYKAAGQPIDQEPLTPFVTASLKVDFLKPTPLNGRPVELRARISEVIGRKTMVDCSLISEGIQTVKAEILAVRVDKLFNSN